MSEEAAVSAVKVREKKEKVGAYEGQVCWRKLDGCVFCNFTVHGEQKRFPKKAKYIRIQNGRCTCDKSKEPANGLGQTGSL